MTRTFTCPGGQRYSLALRRRSSAGCSGFALLKAGALLLASTAIPDPAPAQDLAARGAEPTRRAAAEPVLSMEDALSLAGGNQPSALAFGREAAASESAALAAQALPDPQISAGIQNFPVTGRVAFDPRADDMTMYTIGVMREQVRLSRREAEVQRLTAEALVSQSQASLQERRIRRDVMLSWINAVEANAKHLLLRRIIEDLVAGQRVMEAGVATGASAPALALQAQAEVALAKAQQEDAKGQEARARAEMARWIGAAAYRPVPEAVPLIDLPDTGAAPSVAHPVVAVAKAQERAAERAVNVARQDRKPNITWSVMYGYRPEYGDMVSGTVSIPLQINRGRVQNVRVLEASARADAARLRTQDAERDVNAAYEAALADYRSAAAQLSVINGEAIPSLEASFKAAEARYGAGQGQLELPLAIVRRYVETFIRSIEQQGRRARAAAELVYLTQDIQR
jgi:outer membrane protein, heavy metal efflux system